MIRYLPILMVALGLLLVSTSFAHARTDARIPAADQTICRLAGDTPVHADGEKLGRCWKQMGLGILIAGCKVHAELPGEDLAIEPRFSPCRPVVTDPVLIEGPAPPLDIPPPKA